MLRRSLLATVLTVMLATSASAEWRLPCIIGGCTITFVSPEYAARPVQPLNPQAALAGVNAFRTKNRLGTVVLDARLTRAAAMQSETQAKRDWIGHDGPDGSLPKDRAARAGYRAKIASENVASGQKSDDRSVVRDFCLIFAPLRATMNQKSSLPQAAKSVSQVLVSDSWTPSPNCRVGTPAAAEA